MVSIASDLLTYENKQIQHAELQQCQAEKAWSIYLKVISCHFWYRMLSGTLNIINDSGNNIGKSGQVLKKKGAKKKWRTARQ